MSRVRAFVFILLGLFLAAGLATAQVSTGRIIGSVLDDQGTALPGVAVEATSPRMVGRATAMTDTKGTYRLFALPPGTYGITYTLPGFKPVVRKDIVVRVEETITVDIAMAPGAIEEEVTVIGQSPLIDVKSTARGMTLTKDVFALLPKGRNFDSLVTTVPGVNNEPGAAGTSVDGASGAENMFYVDGTLTSNLLNGTNGQEVNFDFAEEIQFKASGYNAEFGGSVGGVVNVITMSGGNEFHGEVLGYFWGTSLEGTRRNTLALDLLNTTRVKYYTYAEYTGPTKDTTFEAGFNLGGFIFKDKLWFFGSLLPRYYTRDRTLDWNLLGTKTNINSYTRKEERINASFKLTAQPFKNLRMGASFINNFFKWKGGINAITDAVTYTGSTSTNYNIYGFSFPNYTVNGYADLALGNNFLVSVRGGYWFTDQNNQQAPVATSPFYAFQAEQPYQYSATENTAFPEIPAQFRQSPGWANMPVAAVMKNVQQIRDRISINGDVNYFFNLAGEHSVKAGVAFNRQGENVDNTAQQPIVYLGWNMDFEAYGTNYGRGTYGWYGVRGNDDAGPYGNFYDVKMNRWALYLQDSWTIGNKLTLNYGVRTESEYLPSYTTDPEWAAYSKPVKFDFADKIAPRFGAIYDVFGDSSLKIYGSFGIFHDVMKLNMGANALGGFKWKSAYYTLDTYDYTTIGQGGNYPGTLLAVLDFRAPVFEAIDVNMKPFTLREISFGAEKQLMENLSASVRVVNKSVLHGIEDCGVVLPGVGEFYYYTNPGSDFLKGKYDESVAAGIMPPGTPYMPKEKREYWAVNLSLDKRFSNNWLGGFSYTWSSLRGNFGGLASSDEASTITGAGRNSPNGERYFDLWYMMRDKSLNAIDGPLATDRPHVFKAYGSYVFDFGLTVGAIFNAMSGIPVTQEWNVDGPSYFPYNRGNKGRTPFLWFANVYTEYNLRLGKFNINFNVNVDNILDVETARNVYPIEYRTNFSPGDDALLTTTWTIPANAVLDPRYLKQFNFYPPIQVRLGAKISF